MLHQIRTRRTARGTDVGNTLTDLRRPPGRPLCSYLVLLLHDYGSGKSVDYPRSMSFVELRGRYVLLVSWYYAVP